MAEGGLDELRFGVSSGTDTDDAEDGGGDGSRVCDSVKLGVSSPSTSFCPHWDPAPEYVVDEDDADVRATVPPILVYAALEGKGGNITSPGKGCGCDTQLS